MDGMGEVSMPEPAAEAPVDDGIDAAFKQACYSVIDDLMEKTGDANAVKEGLGKLKKLLASHGDVNGDGKVDSKDEEELETEESKKGKPSGKAILEALTVADKVGLKPDALDLQLLAAADPAVRESLAKRLKALSAGGAEKPATTPRETTKTESKQKPQALTWIE